MITTLSLTMTGAPYDVPVALAYAPQMYVTVEPIHTTVTLYDDGGEPMNEIEIKQGNMVPAFEAQLFGPPPGNEPINLQGAMVEFCFGRGHGGPCEIVDAANGRVRYEWQEGDTDDPGMWNGEFVVTFVSGHTQRVPSGGYVAVRITRAVCGRDYE